MDNDLNKPANFLDAISSKLDWSALNAEWENSNERQADFCKRKNINLNAFGYWRSQYISKKNKKTKRVSSFIPVKIKSEPVKLESSIILENTVGIKMIIPANLSIKQLADILNLTGFTHDKT